MVRIQDRMGELSSGILKIVTKDGTEFELKPSWGSKRQLLYLWKQERDKGFSKEIHNEQGSILKQIIKESYPEYDDIEIYVILGKYDDVLLQEIYFGYGWLDREAINAIEERKRKEIERIRNGEPLSDDIKKKLNLGEEQNLPGTSSEETKKKSQD